MIKPTFLFDAEHLCFQGDFTFQTVGEAWIQLKPQLSQCVSSRLCVDLAKVHFIDSACLSLLLALMRVRLKEGKSLYFSNIPDKMLALAKVSGVATILGFL